MIINQDICRRGGLRARRPSRNAPSLSWVEQKPIGYQFSRLRCYLRPSTCAAFLSEDEKLLEINYCCHTPAAVSDRHLVNRPQPVSSSPPMALKFFTGSSSNSSHSGVKHFDIRLDNDYVVFKGGEDEAASAPLSGSLVLCLTEPMAVSHITLTLSGIVHMGYNAISTVSMAGKRRAYKEKTFFEKTWTFRDMPKNKADMLLPDNYEWPFDTILEGSLPESVEGLKDAWIIYRFKAEIARKKGKDIVVRKPVRVVRTLDPTALELAHNMSVENVWPNKIEYSINIPSKAVILGSFIKIEFKLVPLLKGMTMGNITVQVKEEQEFSLDQEWGLAGLATTGLSRNERIIASEDYRLDAEKDMSILDEQAEGYEFTRYLELPKTLNSGLQDCNVKGIKIRHKVKFNIQLHNPDGHISELRANLPISIYISPALPLNDQNDLIDQTPQAGRAEIESIALNAAPPMYGQHHLDLLYADMTQSGYVTPMLGVSAPGTPYLRSRQPSVDSLTTVGAMSNSLGNQASPPGGNFVSPTALHSRLQNLNIGPSSLSQGGMELTNDRLVDDSRRSSGPQNGDDDDYFSSSIPTHGDHNTPPQIVLPPTLSRGASRSRATTLVRSDSEEAAVPSGVQSPFFHFDHMEDLAKIPSYSTAVKAPAPRTTTRALGELPTYGAATSSTPPRLPAEPPTAHVRSTTTNTEQSHSGPSTPLSSSPAFGGALPVPRYAPLNRNLSELQDEDRRLRLSQQRGR